MAGTTVCMAAGPVEDSEGELVDVGDIVEFRAHGLVTLGFIESVGGEGELEIVRLVKREGVGEECYLDESQPMLSVSPSVCRFVDSYPSQRVAWSTASPHHNPHGEESEDVWFIEGTVSDDCEVPTKPISET
uniref:Uncharacterized protein n=1 Tax=Hemiselmis andersenii TaxID=464988 RepID=A0A7S1DD04_HEMAN